MSGVAVAEAGRRCRFALDGLMARYLLVMMARPFSATLLVLLPALLMERLLRLFDLIASQDVPAATVARMLADLVPHYLGIALPAALFAAVYFVIARLSASHELDAMQNAGWSLGWISRPLVLIGCAVSLGGFGLYGYVQPYARYAYRAAYQAATEGAWNATIPAGEITHISKTLMVTADKFDRADGRLMGITLYQHLADGSEKVTTARTGQLGLSPDGSELLLTLQQVTQLKTEADDRSEVLTAPNAAIHRPFVIALKGFRPRGLDQQEMTLGELWRDRRRAHTVLPRRTLDGELHSRLIRALSLAVLPLLAVPFGLAAKRGRPQYGVVIGVLVLVLYYHAIQLVQSFGTADLINPTAPLWSTFAAFGAISGLTFIRAQSHTSEGPLDGVLALIGRAADKVFGAWRGLRQRFA